MAGWSKRGNIRGPAGPAGPKGDPGQQPLAKESDVAAVARGREVPGSGAIDLALLSTFRREFAAWFEESVAARTYPGTSPISGGEADPGEQGGGGADA